MLLKVQRLKALTAFAVLKARARLVQGEAVFTSEQLDVLAHAAVLLAKTQLHGLKASVDFALLSAASETGKFFSLLELENLVALLETRHFDIAKLLADDVDAVDRALVSFEKKLVDVPIHVFDLQVQRFGKLVENAAVVGDSQEHEVGKRVQDASNAVDARLVALSKLVYDTAAVFDTPAVLTGKATVDSVAFNDAFDRVVAYVRVFSDSVDATDEVNALVQMDDGQVVVLNKRNLDRVATNDGLLNFDVIKPLAIAATTQDLQLADLNKPLATAASTQDSALLGVQTIRSDTAITVDARFFTLARLVLDQAQFSDYQNQHFDKALSDTVATSDAVRFATYLDKLESLSAVEIADVIRIAAAGVPQQFEELGVADLAAVLAHKYFGETLSTTDDLLHEANADDDQTVSFGKHIAENQYVSEQRAVSLQRGYAEMLGANDSGVLFLTDYSDSTYFSQSYVGAEQTFS